MSTDAPDLTHRHRSYLYKRLDHLLKIHLSPTMNRDYSTHRVDPSTNTLSRNSSNVSWGTKIRGAMQVTHGLGDAIRGSLGATDFGAHEYTSSGEIATRGRHEIAQGLARIRGVTTQLPPAPVYDRRHSFPTQQYEQPQRARSVWGRRSASAHRSGNPSTAVHPSTNFMSIPIRLSKIRILGLQGWVRG
ncbi:hypothetical protein K438DRAFT_1133831 [Mycena galopus ATCC 62051]|nr:hypothetical protein K438DRAFT_1133831 [Mycena galopus ATCC 62051]